MISEAAESDAKWTAIAGMRALRRIAIAALMLCELEDEDALQELQVRVRALLGSANKFDIHENGDLAMSEMPSTELMTRPSHPKGVLITGCRGLILPAAGAAFVKWPRSDLRMPLEGACANTKTRGSLRKLATFFSCTLHDLDHECVCHTGGGRLACLHAGGISASAWSMEHMRNARR